MAEPNFDEANRRFQEAAETDQEVLDNEEAVNNNAVDTIEQGVSDQEEEESKKSKWLKGARNFVNESPKKLGLGLGVLFGFAIATLAKLLEASAKSMKNMLEKPEKPGEWFKPFTEVLQKDDKKKEK